MLRFEATGRGGIPRNYLLRLCRPATSLRISTFARLRELLWWNTRTTPRDGCLRHRMARVNSRALCCIRG